MPGLLFRVWHLRQLPAAHRCRDDVGAGRSARLLFAFTPQEFPNLNLHRRAIAAHASSVGKKKEKWIADRARDHVAAEFCVSLDRGNVMKKCPSCYAYMKETIAPTQVPKLQQTSAYDLPEVAAIRVRYECSQCGHMEESFAKPAPAQRA